MSNSQWQSHIKTTGTTVVGEPLYSPKQIVGTDQPRPFLLSPGKKPTEMRARNRLRLQIPIGPANSRSDTQEPNVHASRTKSFSRNSLHTVRESSRREHEIHQVRPGKNSHRRRSHRPTYIPHIQDPSKSQESRSLPQDNHSSGEKISDTSYFSSSPTTSSSRPPSSTSSAYSIPDFPVPLTAELAQCAPYLSSNSNFKKSISSSLYPQLSFIPPIPEEPFFSNDYFRETYASSQALPISNRGSFDELSPKQIDRANIDDVGIALTTSTNNDYSNENSSSSAADSVFQTRSQEPGLKQDKYKALPSLSHLSFETLFEGLNKLNQFSNFNPDQSQVQSPELAGSSGARDSECVGSCRISFDDVTKLIPALDTQETNSNILRSRLLSEEQQRFYIHSNKPYEPNPQNTQVGPRINSTGNIQSNNNFNRNYTNKKQISYAKKELPKPPSPDFPFKFQSSQARPPGRFATKTTLFEKSPDLERKIRNDKQASFNYISVREGIENGRRRCYNLPPKILILIILLIALIVVASVVFLVLYLLSRNPSVSSDVKSTQSCAAFKDTRCHKNGFSLLLEDDTCACICANNFTGRTCTTNISPLNCSTFSIAGHSTTVGSSIERLLFQADRNFSVPLKAGLILARFNAANMSCPAENDLVTFNGKSIREDVRNEKPIPLPVNSILKRNNMSQTMHLPLDNEVSIPNSDLTTPTTTTTDSTSTLYVTVTPSTPPMIPGAITVTVTFPLAATSNPSPATSSIIDATSTKPYQPNCSKSLPSIISSPSLSNATASHSSQTSSDTSSLPSYFVPTEVTLDFARITTLYIFQQTNLNETIAAQSALRRIFKSKISFRTAQNVTLSTINTTITADLLSSTLDLGDGKGVFGGHYISGAALTNSSYHSSDSP